MAKDKSEYKYYYIKSKDAPGPAKELLVAKIPSEVDYEVGRLLGAALQTSHKFFKKWDGWGYRADLPGMEDAIEQLKNTAPPSYIKQLKKHAITLWLGPREK